MKLYKFIRTLWYRGKRYFREEIITGNELGENLVKHLLAGITDEKIRQFLLENVYPPATVEAFVEAATEWLIRRRYLIEVQA